MADPGSKEPQSSHDSDLSFQKGTKDRAEPLVKKVKDNSGATLAPDIGKQDEASDDLPRKTRDSSKDPRHLPKDTPKDSLKDSQEATKDIPKDSQEAPKDIPKDSQEAPKDAPKDSQEALKDAPKDSREKPKSEYVFGSTFESLSFSSLVVPGKKVNIFEDNTGDKNADLGPILEESGAEHDDVGSKKRLIDNAPVDLPKTNANTVFQFQAKLYVWKRDISDWNEIGPAIIQIEAKSDEQEYSRIVSRAVGSLRVIGNTRIFKEMKHALKSPKHVTFFGTELDGSISKFLLRANKSENATRFIEEIDKLLEEN